MYHVDIHITKAINTQVSKDANISTSAAFTITNYLHWHLTFIIYWFIDARVNSTYNSLTFENAKLIEVHLTLKLNTFKIYLSLLGLTLEPDNQWPCAYRLLPLSIANARDQYSVKAFLSWSVYKFTALINTNQDTNQTKKIVITMKMKENFWKKATWLQASK